MEVNTLGYKEESLLHKTGRANANLIITRAVDHSRARVDMTSMVPTC